MFKNLRFPMTVNTLAENRKGKHPEGRARISIAAMRAKWAARKERSSHEAAGVPNM